MRIKKSFLVFVLFLLAAMACHAESDKAYADRRIRESEGKISKVTLQQNTEIANLQNRVDKLEESLQTQAATINQLIEQLENLQSKLGENAEKINKLDTKTEKVGKRWVIALWVGIPIIVIVLLGLAFLFLPTPSRPASDGSGRPKCPRCGWEHAPGDTVCKNPACKTQF